MSNENFDALWDYDHPAETEKTFRALLAQTDGARRFELLTQIARAQGLQGNFADGHATLDEVERDLSAEASAARVRLLLERGRLFNSAGEPQRAHPCFTQAWEFGQQIGEIGYAVDAGHMLGILEAPSLDWSMKALELAQTSDDPRARRWLATLYNNIGWTLHDRGDYAQALDMFERAVPLREAQGTPAPLRIARWAVARALRSLNRLDEALAIQRSLAAQLASAGERDGYVDEELGECLLALGRADDARPHFARAYELLSQDSWLAQHEPERLERLRQLSA
ncbi:MAG: tetratricopeptide repeat protein [Anaerolineae bacterium]